MGLETTQVYLMVTDVEESIAFYEAALGLERAERGEHSASFDTGSCKLKVERTFDEATLEAFGLSPPSENRGAGVIVVLEVDDLRATYERAQSADAEILAEPRKVDWGRELFLVQDPDGYVLEVSRPI